MSHESGHVIITFSTPVNSEKPNGVKAWHCLLCAFFLGFVAGTILL